MADSCKKDISEEDFRRLSVQVVIQPVLTTAEEAVPTTAEEAVPTTAEEAVAATAEEAVAATGVDHDQQNAQRMNGIRKQLNEFTEHLMCMLNSDSSLCKPIENFLKVTNSIKTTSGMASALSTFGKYNGASSKLCGRKSIGVQPTAISRRAFPNGGRRALFSGRPQKRKVTEMVTEHKYAKVKHASGLQQIVSDGRLNQKGRPAPHCLAECVSQNISLGK